MEARIDIKNKGLDGNDLSLSDISDAKCNVIKPDWFSKKGIGYSLKSIVGNIKFSVTFIKDGTLNLFLHTEPCFSMDSKNTSVPIWLDYDYLCINGQVVFSERKATWHDKPFTYDRPVKDGETMTIELSWCPHFNDSAVLEEMMEQLHEVYMSKIMPPQCTASFIEWTS